MGAVRWLDWYIDGIQRSALTGALGRLHEVGPFGRIGSVINVAFVAVAGVAGLVTGFTGASPGFAFAVFAVVFEIVFVRVAVRAFRGDFDPFVVDPDEVNDPERSQ